jgi:hypothetical protein
MSISYGSLVRQIIAEADESLLDRFLRLRRERMALDDTRIVRPRTLKELIAEDFPDLDGREIDNILDVT